MPPPNKLAQKLNSRQEKKIKLKLKYTENTYMPGPEHPAVILGKTGKFKTHLYCLILSSVAMYFGGMWALRASH